ncbi:hypothetical protein [Devosia sp. Root105]|uniref:hypothetical protein n=1 Tax=Devosia sp. Root105 TaxID=1736423 RepID=UPI00071572B0|nr:hypothetical protein [Devosia sp. Root105]KQU95254.1 hypothetical protein ASC68_19070 [Devosia sp. Root105]
MLDMLCINAQYHPMSSSNDIFGFESPRCGQFKPEQLPKPAGGRAQSQGRMLNDDELSRRGVKPELGRAATPA